MQQYTHTAKFSMFLTPSSAIEELTSFNQSIGVETSDDLHVLEIKAYSMKSIEEMGKFLNAEPFDVTIQEPKRPCVYLGRADMLLPRIFTCMPQFDDVIFHATEDGMYAYSNRGTLSRVFGSLRIIDESIPDDEDA